MPTLSAILYLISLALPAAVIPDVELGRPLTAYGFELLLSGWTGFIGLQLAWLANPFYFFALYNHGLKRGDFLCYAAIFFALMSPWIIVIKTLIGFYVWLASFIVLLFRKKV